MRQAQLCVLLCFPVYSPHSVLLAQLLTSATNFVLLCPARRLFADLLTRWPADSLPYFFFGEAFFDAFSGSSVVAPANPLRSRGGALAFEIST